MNSLPVSNLQFLDAVGISDDDDIQSVHPSMSENVGE